MLYGPAVPDELRHRLRERLTAAMKRRDLVAVRALRATIATIDNAEAPALDPVDLRSVSIEQSPTGAGAREVRRLELDHAEVRGIVAREIDERRSAAASYDESGRTDRADELRREAAVIDEALEAT